jgi:hypothetical protein
MKLHSHTMTLDEIKTRASKYPLAKASLFCLAFGSGFEEQDCPEEITETTPDWGPLGMVLARQESSHHLPDFMHMGEKVTLLGTIQHYKHITTRRYLNIDAKGNCYRYATGGFYHILEQRDAVDTVFCR